MELKIKRTCLPADKIKKTLLIFFLMITFGISISIFAQENSTGSDNIFLDSDQDGLSDSEELIYKTDPKNQDTDGDGYSDGAEVKSGYDPLKPAPGDKIIQDEKIDTNTEVNAAIVDTSSDEYSGENLTEDLSAKIASMVSEDGTAVNQTVSMETINSMIEEMVSEKMTLEDLPEINKDDIATKKQDYSDLSDEKKLAKIKEDEDEYLSAMFYIIANNFPHDISDGEAINDLYQEIMSKIGKLSSSPEEIEYFNNLAESGQKILDQLSEIEVPESMIDLHIEGLQLAEYAISLKDSVKVDTSDPISSMLSFSNVQNLLVISSDFLNKIEGKLTQQDATVTSNNESTESLEGNVEKLEDQEL